MSLIINRLLDLFDLQIKRFNTGFWDIDQGFIKIYKEINEKTLVKIDRCYMLYQFAKHAATLPTGDVAQVGIYKGGTAKMIAECFLNSKKLVYLFDTFEGLPKKSREDNNKKDVNREEKQQFTDIDFKEIKEYFSCCDNVELRKGFFPDTARGLENKQFSFVYLDADIYQSIKDGLDFFYPRMVHGGIIIFDDYQTTDWPGVEKAVHEFCMKNNIFPIKTTQWQGLIIRT